MSNNVSGYSGDKIQVLKGLEAVRHRPAMYIGDTEKKGLHHLASEILDNSVDEAMAGHAKNISIILFADGETISIEDDGRGIPVDMHPTEGKSALEVAMTMLHAGGKMTSDSSGYVASCGLHGVGASCVNALSDSMIVEVHREGYLWRQEYSKGEPLTKVQKVRKLEKSEKPTGTKTTWHADILIFKAGVKLDEHEITRRLREVAFLNKGLRITFENQATGSKQDFKFDGGIGDYVLYLIQNKNGIYPDAPIYGLKTAEKMQIEIALSWTDDDDGLLFSYANNIYTFDGGTHLSGFKTSLTRTVNKLAFAAGLIKENGESLEGKDIQEGLTAVVSIRLSQPQFGGGNTKAKLVTPEAEALVSGVTSDVLTDFFERNPKALAKVVERAVLAQRARKAAKDAASTLKKKSFLGNSGRIPSKLRDCRSGDNSITELFIVEGDSAAGSASGGRDSETQAILSNKGKIINVEKSDFADLMKNEEVINLMISIGTGVKDNFDLSKLKYGKIIIMSDADDDGYHIRTLLLTFFYRFMRPLIEHGHVYIAQAPLYMIERKSDPIYCWNDQDLKDQLAKLGSKFDVKRFKGLGEMDAEQLAETTMRKGKRHLLQVSMEDAAEAERILTVLMGKNVPLRRQHIMENVNNCLVSVGD